MVVETQIMMEWLVMRIASKIQLPPSKDDYLEQYDDVDSEVFDDEQEKYFAPIGEFITCFSNFEHTLNYALAEFIQNRSHDTGYVVIQNVSMRNKIDLFFKLHLRLESYKGKVKTDNLKALYTEMQHANTFRNYVAHANWQTLDEDSYVRTRITTDSDEGLVKFIKAKITPVILRKNIRALENLTDDIYNYTESAFDF